MLSGARKITAVGSSLQEEQPLQAQWRREAPLCVVVWVAMRAVGNVCFLSGSPAHFTRKERQHVRAQASSGTPLRPDASPPSRPRIRHYRLDYEDGDRPKIVEQMIPSGHPEPELLLRSPGEVHPDHLEGLPEDQAESVTEITGMLFALGNQRIKRASYAIVDRVDLVHARAGLDAFGDIEAVVAYLYASPRHEFNRLFLTPENASIVVLTPNRVAAELVRLSANVVEAAQHEDLEAEATGFVDGYDGLVGLRHPFWVVSGSRVYGTTPHPILNDYQDLASDVEQARRAREDYRFLLPLLEERDRGGDIGRRVFTAVRWFNRANSEHPGGGRILHLPVGGA